MRTLIVSVSLIAFLFVRPAYGQSPEDTAACRAVALEYIEGWYAGDAARVEKVLHPELIKRAVMTDPQSGKSYLITQSLKNFMNLTASNKPKPGARQQKDVVVLDVFKNAAMVRVTATAWVDYMQMHKWNGKWMIVNMLWECKYPGNMSGTLWNP